MEYFWVFQAVWSVGNGRGGGKD